MGAELTRCCGVDDDYYEQINTTKKGDEDEERDSERKKIKRKLKSILVHKDAEFARYIKTEKYERLPNISSSKEDTFLTFFARNELTREITWDILLAIASKKYGEMELARLKAKKKRGQSQSKPIENGVNGANGHTTNHDSDHDHKETEQATRQAQDDDDGNDDDQEESKSEEELAAGSMGMMAEYRNLRDENETLPLSTLRFRLPWHKLFKLVRPSTVAELEHDMQSAVNAGHRIKAMGSRLAWTNVTFTDGLLIDMYNSLNRPQLDIDGACLNKYGKELLQQSNLWRCECGANVGDIQEILWPRGRRRFLQNKAQRAYKMIPDVPGFEDLCIGGLIQCGGYGIGTPYHYGSFVNHVRSFCMLIVDEQKQVRRIQVEPAGDAAIHDVYKWSRTHPDTYTLIQDDGIFHSLLVGVGSCGVMYSAYIELMDAHYLYERRYMLPWKTFKHKHWKSIDKRCKNGDIVRLQLYISPYLTYDKRYRDSPPIIVNSFEYTEEMPMHTITDKDGGHHRSRDSQRSSILAALLATRFAHKWPRFVPFILQMSMESTLHKGLAIAAVDAVQFGNTNAVPTHKSGFGINAASFTSLGDDYIRLCNILRAKCSSQIITQPAAVRFSNPGFGLLNFTYNQSSVILEQSLYDFRQSIYFEQEHKSATAESEDNDEERQQSCTSTTPKLWHSLFKIQDLCMGEKYRGKPHLGLYFHVDENIWKNHDKDSFKEFVQNYKRFNPHQIFSNAFTKESALDKYAGLA